MRSSPSRADLAERGANGRKELRDHRMAALAHYVLSLSRRGGFWSRALRQEPEREPRAAKRTKTPTESEDAWESWEE